MIYHISLQTAGIVVGLFLVLISLPGLLRPNSVQSFARRLPRSRMAGIVLLTIAALWSFWLLVTIEMGEFSSFRRPLIIALPIGYVLVLRFVDEFLAVRALGILCLLAAEPLLDAAFLRYEPGRLLVTAFAYFLVIAGLLWVTIPYSLRDVINWSTHTLMRWRVLHGGAVIYGVIVLALALIVY